MTKTNEEMSELTKILCKSMLHGLDSYNPDDGVTNIESINEEIDDVIACVNLLSQKIPGVYINQDRVNRKMEFISKQLHLDEISNE